MILCDEVLQVIRAERRDWFDQLPLFPYAALAQLRLISLIGFIDRVMEQTEICQRQGEVNREGRRDCFKSGGNIL